MLVNNCQSFSAVVITTAVADRLQQPHFNTVSLDGSVPDDEILYMIYHAYTVVVSKFPKYIQKEIIGVVKSES